MERLGVWILCGLLLVVNVRMSNEPTQGKPLFLTDKNYGLEITSRTIKMYGYSKDRKSRSTLELAGSSLKFYVHDLKDGIWDLVSRTEVVAGRVELAEHANKFWQVRLGSDELEVRRDDEVSKVNLMDHTKKVKHPKAKKDE